MEGYFSVGDLPSTQVDGVEIVFRGVVFKLARNGRLLPSWHRRYAVLNSEGQLYLYSDETMRSVRRVVDLQNLCLRIKFANDTNDDYCSKWPKRVPKSNRISLINLDRTYHFYTESDEEALSWRRAFTSIAGESSNWTLGRAPVSKSLQEEERENVSTEHVSHRLVLDVEDDVGHVSETIITVEEHEAELEEDKDRMQPLEPPGSEEKLDDSSEEEEEGEFSGYDEVGPTKQSNVKERLSMFEKSVHEGSPRHTPPESIKSTSEESIEDKSPPIPDTRVSMASTIEGTTTQLEEELTPSPFVDEKQSPVKPEPETSTGERTALDYSSQVHRLSQRMEKSSRRRNSASGSKKGSSPLKEDPSDDQCGGTSETGHSPSIGAPVETSTPAKEQVLPLSPSHQLTAVPEDTPLSSSTTRGNVMDRVKAFSGGKAAPPPAVFHKPSGGRHRRVSEPVKPKENVPDVKPESSEKDKNRSMTKFTSASAVGAENREPLPWEKGEQENTPEDRVQMAAKWIDKELRKLVHEIIRLGEKNASGLWEVKFGVLFEETANLFEALSGILKTAKKHKIVTYEGELLFQSYHDNIVITLLKEEVDDSTIDKYTTANPKGMKRDDLPPSARNKTSGFSTATSFTGDAKCSLCGKRVYATEFVAANDKPFHKACFKCIQCGKKLTTSTFATIEDKFYCLTHYERLYMEKGNYAFT